MKIQFLGTGAAEGIPAVFCNCEICRKIRSLGEAEFRTRSQVIIDGVLSVDFPPEAFYHSIKFGAELSKLKYLLVSHSHMDHFYAHDFILRGYKYAELAEDKLEIFGNSEVGKVFAECTERELKPEVAPHINFNEISPYSIFMIGGYKIMTLPAVHSKTEQALLFYIEREGKGYLHMYDTGIPDEGIYEFLSRNNAKADAVCFDCTFTDKVGGNSVRHMNIYDNMTVKSNLEKYVITDGGTRYIISHFSHNSNPTRLRLKSLEDKFGVTSAYDGFIIEI